MSRDDVGSAGAQQPVLLQHPVETEPTQFRRTSRARRLSPLQRL